MDTAQPFNPLEKPEAIPSQRTHVNLAELALSPQEAFVFFRVDGRSSVRELCLLSNLGESTTGGILAKLTRMGVLEWTIPVKSGSWIPAARRKAMENIAKVRSDEPSHSSPKAKSQSPNTWQGYALDQAALAEEVDLALETKKEILYLFQQLVHFTYYELLGVGNDADAEAIRRAYFQATKKFHPDRYFRKQLGRYKERLQKVFRQIGKAYDVLRDPQKRAEYDQELVSGTAGVASGNLSANGEEELSAPTPNKEVREPAPAQDGDADLKPEFDSAPDEEIAAEDPVEAEAASEGQQAFLEGRRLLEAGQVVAAHKALRTATALDPGNGHYRDLFDKVDSVVRRAKADSAIQKGKTEEKANRLGQACSYFLKAARAWPVEENWARVADLMIQLGAELDKTIEVAYKAVEVAPQSVDSRRRHARLLVRAGRRDEAEKAWRSICDLVPDDAEASSALQSLGS